MKAHICIGGPLDGEYATYQDFVGYWDDNGQRDRAMYEHLRDQYYQFNTAHHRSTILQRASRKLGQKEEGCHVVWLHRSVLKPSVSPKNR